MSRGPGRIQQTILDLTGGDEHGAWTVPQLCEQVYRGVNRIEKKHRVAVTRALRRMDLPPMWCVKGAWLPGTPYSFYNSGDEQSTLRSIYLGTDRYTSKGGFEMWLARNPPQVVEAARTVKEARRYNDASPIGKLEIEIAELQTKLGYAGMLGSRAALKSFTDEIAGLKQKKAELESAAPAPS